MPVKSIESLSDALLGESINQTGVLFNGAALRGYCRWQGHVSVVLGQRWHFITETDQPLNQCGTQLPTTCLWRPSLLALSDVVGPSRVRQCNTMHTFIGLF